MNKRTTSIRFAIGFVLTSLPLLAAEEGGAATTNEPGIIWTILNFLILAAGIVWLFSKYATPALSSRAQEIKSGLAAGEKAKAEADARAAQVKAQLANLGSEVEAIRTSAKQERDREAERIRRETQLEIERIRVQAENEIEAAGKMARLEVQHAAAKMAIELAEHKVRSRMSPETQTALLQGFLSDLGRNGLAHKE